MTGVEIAIAAIGISALGSIIQGQQVAAAHRFNAQVARNNAIAARQRAEFEEARMREQGERFLATQRAAAAGQGSVVDSGSALLAQLDTAKTVGLDALAIRYEGELEAVNQLNQSRIDDFRAGAAETTGFVNAGTTILTGAARLRGIPLAGGAVPVASAGASSGAIAGATPLAGRPQFIAGR